MNSMQMAHEIEELPLEAQRQIEVYIAVVKASYQPTKKNKLVESEYSKAYQPKITKGDKTIDPSSLFGIWKDNPRNLDDIRKKAWQT